jgi:hypothetical protein
LQPRRTGCVTGDCFGAAIQLASIAAVADRGRICHALTAFFGFRAKEAWAETALCCALVIAGERSRQSGREA